MANPRVASRWSSLHNPAISNAWRIGTPADVELLIHRARKFDQETTSQDMLELIRQLIAALDSRGVHLLVGDRVINHAGAQWDPGTGAITIRPQTVDMGSEILLEVLAHEAAHVAQSCRAGGIGKNSEPMGIPVSPADVFDRQLSSPLYKEALSTKAIELEAFSVAANPEWALSLLTHFCKR